MINKQTSNKSRKKRQIRTRRKISGTAEIPRLNVYRSLKNIYAQIIDDTKGVTLCAASTKDKDFAGKNGGDKAAAFAIGEAIAKKAKAAGITKVVFDRAGYIYHGRVAELAEGARKGGLEF